MTFETSLTFKHTESTYQWRAGKNENECYIHLYSRYNLGLAWNFLVSDFSQAKCITCLKSEITMKLQILVFTIKTLFILIREGKGFIKHICTHISVLGVFSTTSGWQFLLNFSRFKDTLLFKYHPTKNNPLGQNRRHTAQTWKDNLAIDSKRFKIELPYAIKFAYLYSLSL